MQALARASRPSSLASTLLRGIPTRVRSPRAARHSADGSRASWTGQVSTVLLLDLLLGPAIAFAVHREAPSGWALAGGAVLLLVLVAVARGLLESGNTDPRATVAAGDAQAAGETEKLRRDQSGELRRVPPAADEDIEDTLPQRAEEMDNPPEAP